MTPPIILSIAGSDCSGGAGIQADIKTISALGGYAASVITAITVQNTRGVQTVHSLSADLVRAQIEAVMDDLQPKSIKIGMVHNAELVTVIADCIRNYQPDFVVYDPVMISTSGRHLMTQETIQVIKKELFPLCTLLTPNLSEASLLYGHPISRTDEMEQAARHLSHLYHTSILIKGGHLEGNEMRDILYSSTDASGESACTFYTHSKIDSRNLHGTGCTLSSAIATYLGYNYSLKEAVSQAKDYITTTINNGKELQIGHGNGPLWHFPLSE